MTGFHFTAMLSLFKGRSMAKVRVLIPTAEGALRRGVSALVPDLAIYHITPRVVPRQLFFSDVTKEEFRK